MINIPEHAMWQARQVDNKETVTGHYVEDCFWGRHCIFMKPYRYPIEIDPATLEPVAVKPIIGENDVLCPNCKIDMMGCGLDEDPAFCYKCGQRLDWE